MRSLAATLIPMVVLAAAVAAAEPAGEIQVLEDLEFLDEEPAPTGGWQRLVGHLHPAAVHLPIAWLLLLALTDGAAFLLGREGLIRWSQRLLILTVLAMIPAVITGLVNHSTYAEPDPLALRHRNLALATLVVTASALTLRLPRRGRPEGASRWIYLGLIGLAALLVTVTGHLGGRLVFGEEYLPF